MEEKRVELHSNDNNKSKYLDVDELKKIAFLATRANQEEWPLNEVEWKHSLVPVTVQVFALVDLKNQRTYALKFALKTTTSSVTEYLLIPKFPLENK